MLRNLAKKGSQWICKMGDAGIADSLKKEGLVSFTVPYPGSYGYVTITDKGRSCQLALESKD